MLKLNEASPKHRDVTQISVVVYLGPLRWLQLRKFLARRGSSFDVGELSNIV